MNVQEIQESTEVMSPEAQAISVKKKQRGLTTVEYAVAGVLIAIAVVAAFTALGLAVANAINLITNVITP